MKVDTAYEVAKQMEDQGRTDMVIYRAKNGQYMTGKVGNPAVTNLRWTPAEFVKKVDDATGRHHKPPLT